MLLSRFGHSCIRVEKDGQRLVIDPGGLSDPRALDGTDAVLVTHEHFDHFAEDTLRAAAATNPALRIWTNRSVAARLDGLGTRVATVDDGDTFTAAGIEVRTHGSWHAVIHPDIPRVRNVGFLLDGTVFHPGDALTVPRTALDTLLLPVHAPWSTTGQLIDYVREVAPRQAYAIHDGALNDVGLAMVGGFLGADGGAGGPGIGARYERPAPGDTVEVPPAGM